MVMAAHLNESDRRRIETAIAALEARSSAEIAVVVARQAHDYGAYPFLWAAALGLFAGGLLAVGLPEARGTDVILIEGAVFALSYLLLHFTPLGLALIAKRLKVHHARRLAAAEFANLVARHTTEATGVLLFVSLAERHVEILVDRGIDAKIAKDRWKDVVDRFGASDRRSTADRIVATIDECTKILAPDFPPAATRRNEMPDRVTER
jgi:putative membrane protein